MIIFLTQNSHYFVHRYFSKLFKKHDSIVVFVNEQKRGKKRKYREILNQFGLHNIAYIVFMEAILFLFFRSRSNYKRSFNINDGDLVDFLKLATITNETKYIFSIGCPCFIPPTLGDENKKIKLINLHGGIIPYQRGRFSPLKSLSRGDKYIGCSIHEISNEIDSGPVLSQAFVEVKNNSKLDIYNKVLSLSRNLAEDFLEGKLQELPDRILNEISKNHHLD